jgi:putative transposase
MVWFIITHIFSTLVAFVGIGRLSEREKDLEILILRHQLDIVERKQKTPIKPNKAEKMTLAVLTNKLKQIANRSTNQLRNTLRIFQPATVLKWHRELVRRKWRTLQKPHFGQNNCPRLQRAIRHLPCFQSLHLFC